MGKPRHAAGTRKGKRVSTHQNQEGYIFVYVSKKGRPVQAVVAVAAASALFPGIEWNALVSRHGHSTAVVSKMPQPRMQVKGQP